MALPGHIHLFSVAADTSSRGGGGGGEGTQLFSYIRRLESFYWVHNFEFQYFWVFIEK